MTLNSKTEWLTYFKANETKLLKFVEEWHPTAGKVVDRAAFPITAPDAEDACQLVVRGIKQRELLEASVTTRFHKFLAEENVAKLYNLLNSAWFAVPESTSCWSIEGFSEAVTLLENPVNCVMEEEEV